MNKIGILLALSGLALGSVAENLPIAGNPTRLIAYDLRDQTDDHDELVFTREWLLSTIEQDFAITANVIAVENVLTGSGAALLRLAPCPTLVPTKNLIC